ncbi:uncharacterized protein LOC129773665 [Toxorhynchites rutilus septentrionalis]|uniref:uncharacterized protein LOC129773665 n=1 Tax=Toxorhynchites rutilus septentrionalis TaxID=329112 RepID=UPI00247917B1|nr:uncharacterized protein LOC129773665 [Toxorhynchites rutilus septentrionalis]
MSKDDERAEHLLKSLTNVNKGRYETGLLWRYDDVRMPGSKPMAMKRLICLEKRMQRDPDLAEALKEKLRDYERSGYIEKLTENQLAERFERVWYLPIKMWDAAAKVAGVSLNSFLLTGPNQLTSLLSVLQRFREFRIAITGDIREMFLQVSMNWRDQQCLRFLWRNGESKRIPDTFVTKVMTFGATCSPSCAQYVKNHNAQRFQDKFPRAAEAIIREHHVDDMLSSVETEDEAIKLAKDVRFVHAEAGFEIRNWLSNSNRVLQELKANPGEKSMNLLSEMGAEKVLGLWWCTVADTFTFKVSTRLNVDLLQGHIVPTKRQILSTLMTIYDPIGLLTNFLMFLRMLLQEIWRSGVNWDEPIKSEQWEKWQIWLQVLPQVESVTVPRCYRIKTSTGVQNEIQLHVFVDASENGYAAVAYLRFEKDGEVECALVGAKTRVAPLRFVSIPRLELQAAVIGARLANGIMMSHQLKPTKQFFWTDARDVLCWLNSDHRRYNQFVAVRISEILELTEVNEWNWIPTKLNVADDATKWQKLPDFSPASRWFRGPEFLWEAKEKWSVSVSSFDYTAEAVAASCRICTAEELRKAELSILKLVQNAQFAAEIAALQKPKQAPWKNALPKSSSLYGLSPFLDEEGLLRMKGRIDACDDVDDNVKRPILLPKCHPVTDLIIASVHQQFCHMNHQTTLNQIRRRFYVPQLRSTYKRVRARCQLCKIRQAKPAAPEMSALPPTRLKAFCRPFSYGIDYFGPMHVVTGRRTEKRWGVLITCLTVRAIHLEVAHSLTTDSCILSIRNFTARRGAPLEIVSDRGTNFIGACRELKEALQKFDHEKLMEHFVTTDTKWSFNPTASPHFGGAWERLVHSVKKTLKHLQVTRTPTDELLRNMLTEIELIINSRPLTQLPLDDELSQALTPNHFLIGSSDGSKPPITFDDSSYALKHTWKLSQVSANRFWRRWVAEYLQILLGGPNGLATSSLSQKGISSSSLTRLCQGTAGRKVE